jgi:hypothetical protein
MIIQTLLLEDSLGVGVVVQFQDATVYLNSVYMSIIHDLIFTPSAEFKLNDIVIASTNKNFFILKNNECIYKFSESDAIELDKKAVSNNAELSVNRKEDNYIEVIDTQGLYHDIMLDIVFNP